jgi:hypothetical protein
MAEPAARSFRFPDTFVHLGEDATAVPIEVTESFWPDLMSGKLDHLGDGRLVSFTTFESDWTSWEMHPRGEELVCLFSGALDFHLERAGARTALALRGAGAFAIVPRGAWHTADVIQPSTVLFVTPGEGTSHRPR